MCPTTWDCRLTKVYCGIITVNFKSKLKNSSSNGNNSNWATKQIKVYYNTTNPIRTRVLAASNSYFIHKKLLQYRNKKTRNFQTFKMYQKVRTTRELCVQSANATKNKTIKKKLYYLIIMAIPKLDSLKFRLTIFFLLHY